MLKKIDQARNFLQVHQRNFRCPVCQEAVEIQNYGLTCKKNHQFDLSKKGTLYFLAHSIRTEYNRTMLFHRGKMIQSGMYAPVLQKIIEIAGATKSVVDIGCGEGSFLQELSQVGLSGTKIGIDISKDGIYLASNQSVSAFWCVADLTNLPFQSQRIDTILNIFSPSHYQEFSRVLMPGGQVIKVVPESHYLQELRMSFYPTDEKKHSYSNQKVVEKFFQEMTVVENERVCYQFSVSKENYEHLLAMSPLEWGLSQEIKENLMRESTALSTVSIDVRILKGKKKSS